MLELMQNVMLSPYVYYQNKTTTIIKKQNKKQHINMSWAVHKGNILTSDFKTSVWTEIHKSVTKKPALENTWIQFYRVLSSQ